MQTSTNNTTHVNRASAGFLLRFLTVLAILLAPLSLTSCGKSEQPYDIISQKEEARFQQPVLIEEVSPEGVATVTHKSYLVKDRSMYNMHTKDGVWVSYRELVDVRMPDYSLKKTWKEYGTLRPYWVKGATFKKGEQAELWYVYTTYRLRNGEEFEGITAAEIRAFVGTKERAE